jgi:hypothetical protein
MGFLLATAGCALSCSPAPSPTGPAGGPATRSDAVPTASEVAEAPSTAASSAPTVAGEPCGALNCRQFDSAEQAFAAVLAEKRPRVLAIGEAHAQRGVDVPSTTKRFTEQLLPVLADRASDLVIELLESSGKCGQAEKKTAEAQKPVTKNQAASNQNEFLTLGHASKKLGIRPHVLHPSCEDFNAVAKAGPDGVPRMLEMIAKLTDSLVKRIIERNERDSVDRMVVAYGGAMHNDLSPREGREKWSFGPSLASHTSGGFVELDVFVPEFIKDSASWKSFDWYPHYDRKRLGSKVTLFQTGEAAYTMIVAETVRATPAPSPP